MMSNYAVDDYGFLIDEDTAKLIADWEIEGFEDKPFNELAYDLFEKEICDYISEFTGEAQQLSDNGLYTWDNQYTPYNGDIIIYIPVKNYPTLFTRPYMNMEEVIKEFKIKLGKYLPKDFDYRSRICHITGTYYG